MALRRALGALVLALAACTAAAATLPIEHSLDGGRSWSRPAPSPIRQPVEPADWCPVGGNSTRHHLSRLPSGRLLLIKHGTAIGEAPAGRSRLCAFLSEDDGATWIGGLLLDGRDQVSYPDATAGRDGLIHATWDRDRGGAAEILLGRFREADILAGRLVSADGGLGLVVHRGR